MTIGEAGERRSQPGVRGAALVGAGEQGVFAVESQRADGALDCVVVEIDATIVEEACQATPSFEGVADRFAELGLGADLPAACFEEPVEVVDDRTAALVTGVAALFSR